MVHSSQIYTKFQTASFFKSEELSDIVTNGDAISSTTDEDLISAHAPEEAQDDDQWMYTLYDFQENGIVTKQVNKKISFINHYCKHRGKHSFFESLSTYSPTNFEFSLNFVDWVRFPYILPLTSLWESKFNKLFLI